MPMQDSYGREVTDLRISLTQRCNLQCVFCHMEGQPVAPEELSAEEIERCVRAAVRVGVNRVKLTGGEPTLRPDVVEIVERISPLVREVSMTTNGLRLRRLARPLRAAGLKRVNVSLPSLVPETYHRLTGSPRVHDVMDGIRAAREAGLDPIKINVVVLAGLTGSPEETEALVDFAREVGAWIQIIEFENVSGRVDPLIYRALHTDLKGLTEEAAENAFRVERNWLHNRPRYSFSHHGKDLIVEVVQPVENPAFCAACHRIRLTSSGGLKGCLMTNHGLVDLLPTLRSGGGPEEIVPLFLEVIRTRRPFFTERASAPPTTEGPSLPVVTPTGAAPSAPGCGSP
jgi:cyclic pyranopterin phosphate synthase